MIHIRIPCVVVAAATAATAANAVSVEEVWIDRVDGPSSMNDYGRAVAVAADGSVYVAGSIFEQVDANLFAPRFMTIKYAADGAQLWTRTYAGTFASGAAAADHIAIDGNGDIIVAGSTNQGDDWAVLKYDAAGNELWRSVYEANSSFLTEPDDMALDADGNVYLVGVVGDFINPDAGAVVKFDGETGDEAWAERYYGPTFDGAGFSAVAVDASGGVYAVGFAFVPERVGELSVVKYDDAGDMQWTATDGSIGSFTYDRATDVAVDGNGDVAVVGVFGVNSVVGIDLVAAKYDAGGTQLWRQLYVGPDGGTDSATRVAVDGANDIVIVGYSEVDLNDYEALTLKYDTGGALLWEQRVSGDEIYFDWASAVTIDAQDNIYVAGEYDPIGGSRYFTTRYAPDGTEDWFMSYAGPIGGGSGARAVAVGTDGNVYVTGDCLGIDSEYDIGTIRYEQTEDETPGDLNGDGVIGIFELLALLSAWGDCADCADCPSDINDDCTVNSLDLLALLAIWS